jgi:hypothetical protein
MEKQKNQQGSDNNREHAYQILDDRTDIIASSEQSGIDDPVIRATIDKFNNEIANEEEHLC